MENEEINQSPQPAEEAKTATIMVPYRNFETLLAFTAKIYDDLGHDMFLTREQIAQAQNLSPNTIKQQLSTAVQFGLLELKHGVGYKTSELFTRIHLPDDNEEKKQYILVSLKTFPLYNELISHYEKSGILPNVTGIANTIIRMYRLSPDLALKAAKEMTTTLKEYGLLDDRNILRLHRRLNEPVKRVPEQNSIQNEVAQSATPAPQSNNNITYTIPLKSKDSTSPRKIEVLIPSVHDESDIKRAIRFLKALTDQDDDT